MRWISARTRTIAVTTECLPECRVRPDRAGQSVLGWRLRYYFWPVRELTQGPHAPVGQAPDQPAEDVGGRPGVGQGAVAGRRPGPEEAGQRAQLAVGHLV